jgi:arylsulfatase
MKKLKDMGVDDNTIVVFTPTTAPSLYLARWRTDAVRAEQGHGHGRRLLAPAMIRWPGKVPAGKVENGLSPGSTGSRRSSRRRQPERAEELKKERDRDNTYKCNLDATTKWTDHRQRPSNATRSSSGENEWGPYASTTTNTASSTNPALAGQQTNHDVPDITNLRLDPFERTGGQNRTKEGHSNISMVQIQFWRFVVVQTVSKLAMTASDSR